MSDIKAIIKSEFIKCSQDPVHFLSKYAFVQHPQRGRILFNLYPFQAKVVKLWAQNDYCIINKSRQLGISTLAAGYALWLMLFQKDKNILCIATKQETARNMVTKVKFMFNNLPTWLKVPVEEDNKLSLRLNNGSIIKATSAATDAGRSEAVSLLIIDEAAFIENVDQIWASSQQTLSTGGKALVISTPYGTGNFFHKTFSAAEIQANEFVAIKLPWYVHPERDEAWRKKQDDLLGDPRMAAQECFSGDVIIYTKNGPKQIKDINCGEMVLSHDGTYNKVLKTFSQIKTENLYEIKNGLNNIPKFVTGNHPFLNKDNKWKIVEELNISNESIQLFPINIIPQSSPNSKIDLLKYIKAENPIYFPLKFDNDFIWLNKKSRINRFIEFDYDLGFLIGLYLSEGSYWKNVVSFSYNWDLEKDTWPLKLEEIIQKKFNINIFSHYKNKNDKSCNLYIKNQIFKKFIELVIKGGKYSYNKQISDLVYNNSSKETLKGIIDGILIGDGTLKSEYNCLLGLSSPMLVYDVLYINNLLGRHNITLKKRDSKKSIILNKEYLTKDHYTLNFLNTKINNDSKIFSERVEDLEININKKTSKFKFEDGSFLTTLKLNKVDSKEMEVFNLEVENTHTYITEYGITHNCDAEFNTSGDTVFYPEWLEFIKETQLKEPLERRGINKNLWIWETPDYSREYMVVADVARGDGKDYSGAHVIDIESNTQVAEFRDQLPPKEFGYFLVGLASEYNNALLVVENANIGWATLDAIIEREYRHLYHSPKSEQYTADAYLQYYEQSLAQTPGFTVSLRNRPLLVNKFREYVGDRSVTIRSKRLFEEMKVFIWKYGRPEAQTGYNDDLVMPFAIGMYLRDTSLRFQQQGLDQTRKTLDHLSVNRTTYSGVYGRDNSIPNPYSMKINNKDENIRWLI
jgi:hypothetical protein